MCLNGSKTCIIYCAESQQSEQSMTDVEPGISQQTDSEVVAATSLEAMDVNFNCSNNTYVSEDEVYTDITSSLRRPALFQQTASQLVNNTTRDHETVGAVDGIGQSAEACSDSDVSNTHGAVLAGDEVQGSRYHAGSINDNSDDLNRNNTGSDDEFYSPIIGATDADNEEVMASFHDTVSAPVGALSDDEVLSNENDVVVADADTVYSDGEVGHIIHVNEDVIPAASAEKNVTVTNAEMFQQDVHVDADEQLTSQQLDVHEVSPSRSSLLKQLTSDVVAAEDISTTSAEPAASACEDLNTEMMDVIESRSDVMISQQDTAAGPSDAAGAVEQDERQRMTDEAESVAAYTDTDVQQSTKSPTSTFCLC